MANYKRRRSRRQVRCTLCTPWRWRGNGKERLPHRDRRNRPVRADIRDAARDQTA